MTTALPRPPPAPVAAPQPTHPTQPVSTTTTTQISIHSAGDDPAGEEATIVSLEEGSYLRIAQGRDAIFIGPDELPLLVAACERLLRKPRCSTNGCQNWHRKHAATSRPGSPEWFQEVEG